ncbi:hypothetical protein AGR3A_Cc10131 [Agrobacterium tomkonis CFBP 6623]|uniref:Uncharacterized protein n=1 Tax=Agrobacterium tomkonis CFBP 6623 TaxID=1183432 RepID=A0A1S7NL23_9HYPH|nr:hypothetical protein AGR3A_Cc10131 [Agrobacterium tomkonis CFBP 6623]
MCSAFAAPNSVVSRHVSGAQAYNIAMKTGMYFSGKMKKATARPPSNRFSKREGAQPRLRTSS